MTSQSSLAIASSLPGKRVMGQETKKKVTVRATALVAARVTAKAAVGATATKKNK